jgi:hypothetical protein
MIDSLATIVADFPGEANCSRCLAHIVNLVVKIILRQFNVSKKKGKQDVPVPDVSNASGPELPKDSNDDEDMIPGDEDELDEMERVLDKEEKKWTKQMRTRTKMGRPLRRMLT